MKKISCLILAMLFFIIIDVQAQFNVGATMGVQIPVGSSMEGFKTGFGINLTGKYLIKETMAVGINVGYLGLGAPETGVDEVSLKTSFIPLTALFEYYLGSEKLKPYLGADMGAYIFKTSAGASGMTISASKTYFGFAPVLGIKYDLNDLISVVGNLKYHWVATEGEHATMIGIHAGILVKF